MDKKLQVIGLSGTNGSGKDTVGQILAEHYQYLFVSVTELLRNEAKRRDLPIERGVLRTISAEWRRQSGLGVLVDKVMAQYEVVKDRYTGVAMASMRNPGEADRIHELGGAMIWVDADPRIRYDRVQANAKSRGRASEDNKTLEQFLSEEAAEMQASGDAATLNLAAVKKRCDTFLHNDSSDLATLRQDVERELGL